MARISLEAQIAEVRYEIEQRKSVYARIIYKSPSRRSELELHTSRMEAILDTLLWMQENRGSVIEKLEQELKEKGKAA